MDTTGCDCFLIFRMADRMDSCQVREQLKCLYDLEIVTEDQARVRTHSTILGPLKQKFTDQVSSGSNGSTILLAQANRDVLAVLMAHINGYSICLEPITVWKVVQFAKKYQIDALLKNCFDYLQKNITLLSCLRIFHLVQELNSHHNIKKSVHHFLKINFCKVIKYDQFFEIDFKNFKQLLDDDLLNIQSESAVWEATVQWINWKSKQRSDLFGQLMKALRFGRLSRNYIQQTIKSSPIVSKNLANQVLVSKMINEHQKLQRNRKDGLGLPFSSKIHSIRPRTPSSLPLLFGGWKDMSTTDSFETYDWQTNKWFEGKMPNGVARSYHGMEVLDDKLYIFGGSDGTVVLDSLICFDPVHKEQVKVLSSMCSPRCYVAGACLNGFLYAIGGHGGTSRLDTCERYSVSKNIWMPVAPMNVVRSDASATVYKRNIYVAGGLNHDNVENSVEIYDEVQDRWTLIEQMTSPRTSLALICYKNKLYALGGMDGFERLATCECYDFKLKLWSPIEPMAHCRSTFRATIFNDQLLVAGGYQSESAIDNSEVYDYCSKKWKAIKQLNHQRSGFAMVTLEGLPNAADYSFNGNDKEPNP